MSTYMDVCLFAGGSHGQHDEMNAFLAAGYHQTPMSGQVGEKWSWPGPSDSGSSKTAAQATISGVVTARPQTKGAAPITPDPDPSPPEELLVFNQNDDNVRSLPPSKPRKSNGKMRAQAQKQRPKTRGIPQVNKKQSSLDELDLSLKVQPTEKRKSSRRKSKRNTESILTPPEHHNQLEDPKNSDNDRALILSDIDEEDLPRNPQRRKTLERNRVAARKCRVRKRDEETVLASREQAVEDQNRYLSNTYNSLAAEVYFLKNELLRHTNCNCTLIQEYIANEAKRTVEKMSRSPFNPQASHSNGTPSAASDETIQTSYMDTDYCGLDSQTPLEAHAVNCSMTQYSGHSGVPNTTTAFHPGGDRRETFPLDHWSGPIDENMHTDTPWQFEANYNPDLSTMDTAMATHNIMGEPSTASTKISFHEVSWNVK